MLEHSLTSAACLGVTKSGNPCRAKATLSGYCPMHDPAKIAKQEQERQAREAAKEASQARYKRLSEVIDVITATCKNTGWYAQSDHFDFNTAQYASLDVSRYFSRSTRSEKVIGMIDITLNENGIFRLSIDKISFYGHGLSDLNNAILLDLKRSISWLKWPSKPSQPTTTDALQKLENLLRRFHLVAHQLTQRHDGRRTLLINDEYDVQDLLHALLLTLFDDVRPEDPVPNHAGKSSRMDFLLKKEKIMVEAKMTREDLRDTKIGEQLIIDIERYRSRVDCQTLVCFVYDPGHYLKNPKGLEGDLSRKHDNLSVHVII